MRTAGPSATALCAFGRDDNIFCWWGKLVGAAHRFPPKRSLDGPPLFDGATGGFMERKKGSGKDRWFGLSLSLYIQISNFEGNYRHISGGFGGP